MFNHVPCTFPEYMVRVVRAFPNIQWLFVCHSNSVGAFPFIIQGRVPKMAQSGPPFGSRQATIEPCDNEPHPPIHSGPRLLENPTKDDDSLA